MDAELRTLLDHSQFHQGAVREVAQLLPAADDALAALIDEAIAAGDQLGYLLILTAALEAGRRVDARHLAKSVALAADVRRLGNFAWHMEGDVAGALVEAVQRGGIGWELHAGALFIAAAWCAEKRGGELPADFAAHVRNLARQKTLNKTALPYLVATAAQFKDEAFATVLLQHYPHVLVQQMAPVTAKFTGSTIRVFAEAPLDLVPATPPKVLARGRPMQRAVEKVGRNELCPCGSGLKYKRCCADKDQERLHLSSEVAGHTHAELRAEPETGLTRSRLDSMPPFELALIDPRKVPEVLRRAYVMRLVGCQLLERATEYFEVQDWNEERKEEWDFTIFFIMRVQRQDLAERIVAARARHQPNPEEFGQRVEDDIRLGIQLLIARDDPAAELRILHETALKIFGATDPEQLIGFGYGVLCSRHSALGILLCRSLIPLMPAKKASFLLEEILVARDRLNLPPDDPFSDVLEKRLSDETSDEGADAAALRAARKRLEAKAAEVRQLHEEIERQRRALERQEKRREATPAAPQPASDESERRDLRQKLTYLKGRLHERSAERANLRRDLEKAQGDLEKLRRGQAPSVSADDATAGDDEAAHYLPEQPAGNQPLRLIEFPHRFRETLDDLPRQAARSALAMIGRLAGGEPAAFAGVVQLRACAGILRQRIGSEHRLLFRLLPDRVQVIDLINRRDLDRRIKTLRAAGGT
ncbi:MAG TPA: SEC-C metal-binding domain-containing protein [Chthoniobacteraceae bacterium]|jgi:hypothetical protein|nr:SEC-C metal-binding domain-containing protein [Chthoniobacteraceae bacterium]